MNRLFIRQLIPFFALVLLLLVVYCATLLTEPTGQANRCEISAETCRFLFSEHVISAEILPKPVPIEEEIKIRLSLPQTWTLQEAYIQGVNMYMGKIPVLFESPLAITAEREGVTYLGACSERNMRWQLVVEAKNAVGEPRRAFFSFSTSW